MKLVLTYIDTDGFTYSSDIHHSFEYESVEKAEIDLLELWENWNKKMDEYDKYEEQHPRPFGCTLEKLQTWVNDPFKPKYPDGTLNFAGIKDLSTNYFTTYIEEPSGNGPRKTKREKYIRKREYDMPKIRTLEQWWIDGL